MTALVGEIFDFLFFRMNGYYEKNILSGDEHRSKETGQETDTNQPRSSTKDNEELTKSIYILEVGPTGINELSVKDEKKKIKKILMGDGVFQKAEETYGKNTHCFIYFILIGACGFEDID